MTERKNNAVERLWGVREVAERLDVHKETVRRWVREDAIPYRRVGRQIRFDPQEIEEWTRPEAA